MIGRRLQPGGGVRRQTDRGAGQRAGWYQQLQVYFSLLYFRQSLCGSFTSSYCSTLSISCSPLEANSLNQIVHSQSQLITAEPQATPPLSAIGPSFSEIQKEFQKEVQGGGEATSIFCGSVLSPLQVSPADDVQPEVLSQTATVSFHLPRMLQDRRSSKNTRR